MEDNNTGDKKEVHSDNFRWSLKYVVAVLSSLNVCLLGVIVVFLTHPHFNSNESEQEKVTHFTSGPIPLVHDDAPTSPPPCLTKECVTTSSYILNKMDFSVSPCENMYLYACGGLHAKTKFPKKGDIYSVSMTDKAFFHSVGKIIESNKTQIFGKHSRALVKMRSFYQTCIDKNSLEEKGISSIVAVINELGSWTMSNVSITPFDSTKWSLKETLMKLHKMGSFIFFSVEKLNITLEATKQKTEIIVFEREITEFISLFNFGPWFWDYLTYIAVKLAESLGGDPKDAKAKAGEIMGFLQDLENVKPSYTKPMPLKVLQEHIGYSLDLKDYLKEFFGDEHISNETIVECHEMPYFMSLGKALKKHDKSVVANVLVLKFLYGIMDYLPKNMLVPERWISRETVCTSSLLRFFAAPMIAIYVQDYFKHETKAKVTSIFENIKKEIVKTFSGVPWMDEKLKEAFIRKSQLVEMDPAYPDWILDPVTLDKIYDKVEVLPGELLKSFIGISKERVRQRFHHQPHSPTMSWEYSTPKRSTAYCDVRLVAVNITISYLQPPVYSPLFPTSFQYGSLGFVLGHEFTHYYDLDRRQVDANYLPISPSWTASANESFIRGVSCLADLYRSCTYDGIRAVGDTSLDEDICDNQGLKLAYRAYKALGNVYEPSLPGLNLTDDQMFFLAVSQTFCNIEEDGKAKSGSTHNTDRIRVMGTISNSEEFAMAFSCPPDSPMNPKKKCQIY